MIGEIFAIALLRRARRRREDATFFEMALAILRGRQYIKQSSSVSREIPRFSGEADGKRCRRGGIGRRARFRSVFRKDCGFNSHRRYHFHSARVRSWTGPAIRHARVWHNGCAPAFQAGYTGSTPVTRSMKTFRAGGVAERSNAVDCKSTGIPFGGSNPPPTTIFLPSWAKKHEAVRLRFMARKRRFMLLH